MKKEKNKSVMILILAAIIVLAAVPGIYFFIKNGAGSKSGSADRNGTVRTQPYPTAL